MSQRRTSNKKQESLVNKQQQEQTATIPPRNAPADTQNLESNDTSQIPIQSSTHQKTNPEISEKKVDGRKRGFRSAYKKAEKQQEEQQPVSAPLTSEENCLKLLTGAPNGHKYAAKTRSQGGSNQQQYINLLKIKQQ
ncbi:hypothetical protein ABPG72_010890 [Tetrahymena utriculariae]